MVITIVMTLFTGYECPDGYNRWDLDYKHRTHFTYMTFGTTDDAFCCLKGVDKKRCQKANGKSKFWITYYYGYGEFHITKFDRFSQMSSQYSASSYDPSSTSSSSGGKGKVSGSSTSTSLVPQYFAVRALYFKVRGVTEVTITFTGDISKTVSV